MKKKRITYGVYGMMEYQAVIKIGRATLKVLFTDGSMTAIGQNPAQFTTTDFLTQHAIEHCSDFKRGLIKRVSVIELSDDVRIERNLVQAAPLESGEEQPSGEVSGEEQPVGEVSGDVSSGETLTVVEFGTNQEAKDYLTKTFGVKGGVMKNRSDIVAMGEANGVKIVFVTE